MNPEFENSFQDKLFCRYVTTDISSGYELIRIDGVPDELSEKIKTIWDGTVGQLPDFPNKKILAKEAHNCSMELYSVLPWESSDSGKEFDEKTNKDYLEDEFYKDYLKQSRNETPDSLFDLCSDDALNCIGHSLVLNEVIRDNDWDVYALFSNSHKGSHHTFARNFGDYFVRIEPISGPRQLSSGQKNLEEMYIYEKKDFQKLYLPTPFMLTSVKK